MQLPPFSDFLATLTEEKLASFVPKDASRVVVINGLLESGNLSELIKIQNAHLAETTTIMFIELLRAYHEWLGQSPDQTTPD